MPANKGIAGYRIAADQSAPWHAAACKPVGYIVALSARADEVIG